MAKEANSLEIEQLVSFIKTELSEIDILVFVDIVVNQAFENANLQENDLSLVVRMGFGLTLYPRGNNEKRLEAELRNILWETS
ncbi:hypothetical protein QJS10_CPB11g00453 [Acorus calamus]|uniref:Uncharacterized protein n=1 Tax=Acorus calamus TaxID=4465 RepID=A0AAV9DRA2_ACOCL|nr:hypothetical protein QJS10_CPB11g00453 [Acorus calamus]